MRRESNEESFTTTNTLTPVCARAGSAANSRIASFAMLLIHERVAVRAVLAQVDLKPLLGAAQLPGLIFAIEVIEVYVEKPQAQIRVAEGHTTQVRHVADAAVDVQRAQERDCPDDHHHVFRLHGEDEKEQHDLVGIEHAEGDQQAEDRSRGADCVGAPVAHESIDGYIAYAGSDAAEKVVLEKTPRAPVLLEGGSKHPERQHVEQDVLNAAMQEHVGRQLPDGEML